MTNLNCKWEFEMAAAVTNLGASWIFTCFTGA